jgi:hypothetical protein
MGMYDDLKCEYPLPNKEVQNETFQTKDFECQMEEYLITREGKIIHHAVRYETVPEKERPYYGTPEWDEKPFVRSFGCIRTIPVGDVEIPFHGDITFYTYLGDVNTDDYEWYEYEVRFTEGILTKIKRINPTE